jgi:hypothetical protein
MPGEDPGEALVDPPGLVAGAISGVIDLPNSSIIRGITGATRRDRMLRGAILAGLVRRSSLRGMVLGSGCPSDDGVATASGQPPPPPDG